MALPVRPHLPFRILKARGNCIPQPRYRDHLPFRVDEYGYATLRYTTLRYHYGEAGRICMAYLGSKWRFLGVFPLEEQPKPRELPRGLIECPLSFHRFLAFGVHTPSRSGIVAYLGVFGRICQYATTTAPFSAYSSTLRCIARRIIDEYHKANN